MGNDLLIFELSARQHGLVTLDQLLAAGLARSTVADRVASGWLVRVNPRVFRYAAVPPTWSQSVASLVLSGGPEALAARRSAAALWSLDGSRRSVVEAVVPRWSRRHPGAGRVIESTDLRPSDRGERDGIPTTSVNRTLIDSAAKVHPVVLGRMADDAVRRRLTTYVSILDRFVQLARRGRPGTVAMRGLLDERLDLGLSNSNSFELLVRRVARRDHLPAPVAQHPVDVAGHRFYLDLAWPPRMVGVECDGWATHGTPDRLQADLERQNLLVLAGWTILRFDWRTVHDTPDRVPSELRLALGA